MQGQRSENSSRILLDKMGFTPSDVVADKNIYLIGFMGSGKTRLGVMLAETLNWPFVDTDVLIEGEQGMTIMEIFEKYGEPHFRQLELKALEDLSHLKGRVVALGGGTPARPQAWPYLKKSGMTVYIKRSPEQLLEQLRHDTTRPLLRTAPPDDPLSFIRALLAEREPYYLQADLILECKDGWSKEETFYHLLCLLEGKL